MTLAFLAAPTGIPAGAARFPGAVVRDGMGRALA